MLKLTAEQVRTLAPDASAARAGEGLADKRRWSGTGRTESAAWGLCQGSGSSPYQAAVDLGGPAYKCSCPSRKIPCKHALGLLFLLAGDGIGQAEPPDWAGAWLESRAARATASATRAERPTETDPAARARRAESRERKVAAGVEELDRWLADLVRRGLDSVRAENYRAWDAMGARLVDAQAGGLGRSVRALGSAASGGELWPHTLLEGTARLHLLREAYRRLDQLPPPLQADVRAQIGWTTREDELDAADSVEDRWLVVGQRVDDSGQVITARTCFLGEASGRFAVHLAFGVGAAPPTLPAVPGQAFRATLAFYPSATPLRAVVRPVLEPDGEVTVVRHAIGIADVVCQHAGRLADNPFLFAWPVAIGPVVPVVRDGRLLARDADGAGLLVAPSSLAPRLLAVSGGHPVTLVGEWDGSVLRALSLIANSRLVPLEAADGTAPMRRDPDPAWAALVSAALLGTERAGDAIAVPDEIRDLVPTNGAGREHGLLAAAGILALRRRAGRKPETDGLPLPTPAPDDPRPALRGEAARLFGMVLIETPVLLREALGLVATSSRRLPDEWLPEILAAASEDPAIAERVAELAGPRARWLSEQIPELAAPLPPAPEADWEEAWDAVHGAKPRAALVRSMRQADPAAARARLEGWLPEVAGADRAAVVEALATKLGQEDEALLSSALADGRLDVRRAAADLLARLDGSTFAQLVQARARPLLQIQGRLRPSLAVTLPVLDAELESAGFGGKPPVGLGARAWLLRQLVAHVHPASWERWLGTDRAALIARALRSDEARPVLEGWIDASSRFAAADWVAELIAEPKVMAAARLDPRAAIGGLPEASRASVVARAARSVQPQILPWLVAQCPPPWPEPVADAVIGPLRTLPSVQYPDQHLYELVRAAAVGLPPEREDELAALASYEGQIRPALVGAIETMRLRARVHAAFTKEAAPR